MNKTLNSKSSDILDQFAENSFRIKSTFDEKEIINNFLDNINGVNDIIIKKTRGLETLNEALQEMTWIEDPLKEETLIMIDGVLLMCKGLLIDLEKEEENFKENLSKYCSGALEEYRDQIDLLEEIIQDLYDIFFVLPNDPEFIELNKRLQDEI